MTAARRRNGLGGTRFCSASALPVQGGLANPARMAQLIGAVLIRPGRLISLLALLARAPMLDLRLSGSAAGDALRDYFTPQVWGVVPRTRLCRAVLILPEAESDYTRGRHRRALRTNVTRAARAGIRCGPAGSGVDGLDAMRDILHARHARPTEADLGDLITVWPALFDRPEVTLLAARDSTGVPLALAAVIVDDKVCLIRLAVASSHDARWALHHHLVGMLITRGVRYLLTEEEGALGVLGAAPNVRLYQHLLGYELCHLRLRGP